MSASQKRPTPCSNVRQKTIASGAEQDDQQVAERDEAERRSLRTLVPRRAAAEPADERAARANEIASSTTATAAAPSGSPLWIWLKTKTDATSVLNGRFPEISTIAPISPTARANASVDAGEDPREDVRQHDPPERR